MVFEKQRSQIQELHIDHGPIDDQHQELFQIVSALDSIILNGVRCEDVASLVAFLEHYVKDHFAAEEQLMLSRKFSGYPVHKAEHELFKALVQEIRTVFDGGDLTRVVFLIRRVGDKLVHHVIHIDSRLQAIRT